MGGMAEMVSHIIKTHATMHGSMVLVVSHKVHWYNGLLWFVMYSMNEIAGHGWDE